MLFVSILLIIPITIMSVVEALLRTLGPFPVTRRHCQTMFLYNSTIASVPLFVLERISSEVEPRTFVGR